MNNSLFIFTFTFTYIQVSHAFAPLRMEVSANLRLMCFLPAIGEVVEGTVFTIDTRNQTVCVIAGAGLVRIYIKRGTGCSFNVNNVVVFDEQEARMGSSPYIECFGGRCMSHMQEDDDDDILEPQSCVLVRIVSKSKTYATNGGYLYEGVVVKKLDMQKVV